MKKTIKNILIKLLGEKAYYLELPVGLLALNGFVQRIFRINNDTKYTVHYTTKVMGFRNIRIIGAEKDSILKSLAVSGGCYINIFPGTTFEIGEGSIWAWGLTIITGNHGLIDRNVYEYDNITIGKNCWMGAKVTILPGVILGDNVTVAANSVVTKSFPGNVVIGGIPAKIIKNIQP